MSFLRVFYSEYVLPSVREVSSVLREMMVEMFEFFALNPCLKSNCSDRAELFVDLVKLILETLELRPMRRQEKLMYAPMKNIPAEQLFNRWEYQS